MPPGNFNSTNIDAANYYNDTGPANPTPPTDQFNFANFASKNFYYGTLYAAPYRGAGRNFNARNFRNPNFRNDAWALMAFNFNPANFQTEVFPAKVYPVASYRRANFAHENFGSDVDLENIAINLPAVLLSITGDVLVNIGAKLVNKTATDHMVTVTPNDLLILNATR